MSKKITADVNGTIVGKEYIPAKAESEYQGKKYSAKPESYVFYVLLGDQTKEGFFETMPDVCKVSIAKSDFDKVMTAKSVKCKCSLEYDNRTITAIEGFTVLTDKD